MIALISALTYRLNQIEMAFTLKLKFALKKLT